MKGNFEDVFLLVSCLKYSVYEPFIIAMTFSLKNSLISNYTNKRIMYIIRSELSVMGICAF